MSKGCGWPGKDARNEQILICLVRKTKTRALDLFDSDGCTQMSCFRMSYFSFFWPLEKKNASKLKFPIFRTFSPLNGKSFGNLFKKFLEIKNQIHLWTLLQHFHVPICLSRTAKFDDLFWTEGLFYEHYRSQEKRRKLFKKKKSI